MSTREPVRLSVATQVLELRDAYNARCACGLSLSWTIDTAQGWSASAQCVCGMWYRASMATITIEGTDTNHD